MKNRLSLNVETAHRRRRIQHRPEQALHIAVVDLLALTLPANAVFFHVPNGGARSPIEAKIFKRMGVRAGVPDLIIVYRGHPYFLELKADNGTLEIEQRAMHAMLRAADTRVEVIRSLDDLIDRLREWDIPLARDVHLGPTFRRAA